MKAWSIKGTWLHKKTQKEHYMEFNVVSESNKDPILIISDIYDMDGMTYLGGAVEYMELPSVTVRDCMPPLLILPKK